MVKTTDHLKLLLFRRIALSHNAFCHYRYFLTIFCTVPSYIHEVLNRVIVVFFIPSLRLIMKVYHYLRIFSNFAYIIEDSDGIDNMLVKETGFSSIKKVVHMLI